MNSNNIVFFLGNVAAPALRKSRAKNFTQDRRFEHHDDAQLRRVVGRVVPVMVWHTNPASNQLECRWVLERGAATDEGVSCNDSLRHAA
jgi:hypothetical protein